MSASGARKHLQQWQLSMSCIHLHVGQAGNQIGRSFWTLAEEEYLVDKAATRGGESSRARRSGGGAKPLMRPGGTSMFHEDGWARCLAVDSEPKVVQDFQGSVGSLRQENAIFSQSGLANNWAMGFASCRGDSGVGDARGSPESNPFSRCMDGMRKEAERCCWLNSVVMTHSLAGGTGSGLGSGLLQALRDEYPSLYLLSLCVAPFGTGDTPLQHYNSALALHHLEAFADAIIYRGNDDLLLETQASVRRSTPLGAQSGGGGVAGGRGWHRFSGSRDIKNTTGNITNRTSVGSRYGDPVSTRDMNAALSLDMASYFFPTSRSVHLDPSHASPNGSRTARLSTSGSHRYQETVTRQFDGGSLMTAACPLPGAKFVDLRSTLSVGQDSSLSSLLVDRPRGSGPGKRSNGEWAALANNLGKLSPLCPRKGGGMAEDVCIAAHQVVRGVIVDSVAVGRAGVGGGVSRTGSGEVRRIRDTRQDNRRKSSSSAGTEEMAAAATTTAEASGAASEALRKHHECPEWRTFTNVSCSPALTHARAVSRAITTVCNQTRIRGVLDGVLKRAEEKFTAKAYLHWYHRHGLEDEDFLAAFEGVRAVKLGYDGLARALSGESSAGR